jgi:hypothetical protein
MVPGRVTHLYGEGLRLQASLVVLLLRGPLVYEVLLLRPLRDLIHQLLLCRGQLHYLLVVEVEPPEVVLVMLK